MMSENVKASEIRRIYFYSDYLKETYGEKVYKLPINLPGTCPNRDGKISTGGCIYCAESGANYDALSNTLSVGEQLSINRTYIGEKYKAKKFIAYFQNFTGTYVPLAEFKSRLEQAVSDGVVEISVSTRPDCLTEEYLLAMREAEEKTGVRMSLELGLQTANDETLKKINRGHSVADFVRAADLCKIYSLPFCVHVILNLPWDTREDVVRTARLISKVGAEGVKMHSLNILKGTVLAEMYARGEIKAPEREEYVERALLFLKNIHSGIAVHRLIGRAPEEISVVENFNASWRSVYDEIVNEMERRDYIQGMDVCKEFCL